LNRDFIGTYVVNGPNAKAANQYNFLARQWESSGKALTALPAPPSYVALSLSGFDSAWANYTAQVSRCFIGQDSGTPCLEPGLLLKAAIVAVPSPPAPTILAPAPPAAVSGSPIGQQNGDIFMSSNGDSDSSYPNGSVYVDANGKQYQKSIFVTPFNTVRFWTPLGR
jgi:hypothetical protein